MTDDPELLNLGGGSLLIAWQLKDKNVLIVGGGEVASQRIESILTSDAHISVLSPENGLNSRTKHLIHLRDDRITYHNRRFAGPTDLTNVDMVLTALDDVSLSREICEMCRGAMIPVNAADIPDSCDFYFGSQIRDGPLQIMISTNGNGPRMANLVKTKLKNCLSGTEGTAVAKVGELRAQLKVRAPGVGGVVGRKRMKWMTRLCDAWDMEDLALLGGDMMQKLLDDGWEKNRIPTFEELGGHCKRNYKSTTWGANMAFPSTVGFIAGVLCTILVVAARRR